MNLSSQTFRRTWVVGLYAYLLVVVPLAVYSGLPAWLSTLLVFGYVLAPLPGKFYSARLNLWGTKPLDERQHALRNFAYRLSYQIILCFALIIAGFYWVMSMLVSGVLLELTEISSFIAFLTVMLFFAMLYLPVSIVAWLEPDPLPDEDAGNAPHLLT